jgi:excinuclease ABC subunit C
LATPSAREASFSSPVSAKLPLADLAQSLPELPGVYRFLDGSARPVYVGKAKDLRKRVLQHLSDRPGRKDRMIELAADIDFTVTPNESAALLLERNLIRRFQPKFNVSYKDDKDYPYIVVTKDAYPRIHLSRDKKPDGHTFGPFASAAYARQTIGFVRRHFQIRDCPEFIPGGCLSYHIKLCTAPCIEKVTQEEYGEQARQALTFLRGERRSLLKDLQRQMGAAAEKLEFEKAARLRDTVRAIERTVAQDVDARGVKPSDADYFGVTKEGLPCVFLIRERGRGVVDRRHLLLDNAEGAELPELLGEVLVSYYETAEVPKEVFVPYELADRDAIQQYLEQLRGSPVRLHHPERGHAHRLVLLAQENAVHTAKRELFKKERVLSNDLSKQLQEVCEARRPVRRVEGFDISHTAGDDVVASMVVFENGMPKKSHYRKFKLKVDKNDDFGAMAEVVGRRYGGSQRKELPLPDLVLIDGGRGQLNWALKAARDVGLELDAVGLAKKEEELYLRSGRVLDLDEEDPALKLLISVRDEAHRFAISYHRQRRGQSMQRSGLENVPGVGPTRARRIWKAFAGLEELKAADSEAISARAGVPLSVGRAVFIYLHPDAPSKGAEGPGAATST